MNGVNIIVKEIPAIELRLLCKAVLEATQRFYEDPENVRRFEEWRAAREKEASNG